MKQYYLGSCDYEKFEYQNRDNKKEPCECEFASQGCMLDNFLIYGKRGLLLLQEHYLNCWSSDYLVTFAPYKNKKDIDKVWEMYEKIQEQEED